MKVELEIIWKFFLILIIEANKMYYISTLFWYKTLDVSDTLTVHHQES